ncbi:NAD(P)H-quinone oxidoreductase [Asticcacaulis solisilvae]|uniref:NAD(P)H-quinone oxidoreductase n=1 Tax=Asticcacaulis solisilvae TaxID=1217274 RepID=UPI003FD73C67
MKVVSIDGDGQTPEQLRLIEMPRPELAQGHVLIRTAYAGVNRPDILQRRGLYPPPPGASPVLGLEVSGTIDEAGPGVTGWKAGDAVCALVNGGGYAEFAAVDARHLLPLPKGLTLEQAGSLPETVLTVYANLMEHGALKANETVLVHGGNSGIGSMTIQMGKAIGAKVVATARGADKCAFAKSLGADLVIDSDAEDFIAPVKDFGGADVVLDIVAGDFVAKNLLCLNFRGRMVQVGTSRAPAVELDLRRIMQKQAVLTGSMLRPRSPDEKARLTAAVKANVWPLIEAGRIRPVIDRVFDFAGVAAAHAYMDSGAHKGKVVLKF